MCSIGEEVMIMVCGTGTVHGVEYYGIRPEKAPGEGFELNSCRYEIKPSYLYTCGDASSSKLSYTLHGINNLNFLALTSCLSANFFQFTAQNFVSP
jgi:hypothetical protein